MTRVLAHYISFEMAVLGLVEFMLSFLLIYVMLTASGIPDMPWLASPELSRDCINLAAMLALTIGGTAATIGLYRSEVFLDRTALITSASAVGLVAFPAVLLVSGGFNIRLGGHQVVWLAKLLAIWLSGALTIRMTCSLIFGRSRFARRLLIIGTGARADRISALLRARHGRLLEVVLAGPDMSSLSVGALREQRIWGVVVAGDVTASLPVDVLLDSKNRGIRLFDERSFHEQQLGRIDLDSITAEWLLFADGFDSGKAARVVKRALDISVSVLLLLLTFPLMACTALLIRLESRGPALYRQQRVGLHGAPFTLFKFRSMRLDAEAGGAPRWAQKKDPRVTRIGGFIRMTRIDELPQLLNVLSGEMSISGPRPERPHFVEQLAQAIPFYHQRSYVKPGITGWAQVNFPYGASIEDAREKLAYDLYYVKNANFLLDLLILLSTVRVILFREGAR